MQRRRYVWLAATILVGTQAACVHPQASANRPEKLTEELTRQLIVQWQREAPDPTSVLRQPAQPVSPDDDLPGLLQKLREALSKTGGVGIAAPQIGVSRRVFLIKHGTRPHGQSLVVRAYIDPELLSHSDETEADYEACLSVASVGGQLPRAKRLRLRFTPESDGPRQEIELVDWDARIAQHELDHLDGKLYIDRVVGPLTSIDEMRRRRDEGHRARGWIK